MNLFGKITSGVLLGLILFQIFAYWRKWEGPAPSDNYFIFCLIFSAPILFGYLLKLIFRNKRNANALQWLPNGLNIILILFISILISWQFDPLTNSGKTGIEQNRIEKAVKKWIKKNAIYPDSYQPLGFWEFWQESKPGIKEIKDIKDAEPIGYTVKEHPDTFEFAYYTILHSYVLKNKSGSMDTIIVSFRLSPGHVVKDVRLRGDIDKQDRFAKDRVVGQATNNSNFHEPVFVMYNKESFSSTNNIWRGKYGNDKRNLELELNGNTSETYYYRIVNPKLSNDFTWELNQTLLPYSMGRLNGTGFKVNNNGDTTEIATYRDGELNGIKVSFSSKRDTTGIQTYKAGKLDGISYLFNEGKIAAIETFKDGVRNGITEEICPNGTISFKGNLINGNFYGLSTWWHCNGKKESEGIRVKGVEVGKWKYWDENGKLIKTENKGNLKLLDSIPKE